MNRRNTIGLSTMALLFVGTGLPASNAVAQQDQLVGTWVFVSAVNTKPDGTKFDPYDGKGVGVLIFDSTGHFARQTIRSDIPKLASNNRQKGTAEEFEAVAKGVLSYFGTYSLDESGKTLTEHIEISSFPNFNGEDRTWTIISLTGDELTMGAQVAASGGSNELKFKRAK